MARRIDITGPWSVLSANRWSLAVFGCCIILMGTFLYLLYLWPESRLGPKQPIAFSHRVHAGVKQIQCRFCHPYVGRSTFPGMPPVEKCLYCHRYVIPDHPEIRKEHQYFNSGTSIPWVKVNYLPEHVFFNHERHIKKEIECEACHGAVKNMDRLKKTTFQMGFCVECHREKEAPLDCWLACHN